MEVDAIGLGDVARRPPPPEEQSIGRAADLPLTDEEVARLDVTG
jgi:hypothetical protein